MPNGIAIGHQRIDDDLQVSVGMQHRYQGMCYLRGIANAPVLIASQLADLATQFKEEHIEIEQTVLNL